MLSVAYCLSPYHFLQALCLHRHDGTMVVLSSHADTYRPLLDGLDGLKLISIEKRRDVLADLARDGEPFDFYFATVWNRTGLRFEKLCVDLGGTVHIFEDGLGAYLPAPRPDWRMHVRRLAYRVLDGTQYCDDPSQKCFDRSRTVLYSVEPRLSTMGSGIVRLDVAPFRELLPRIVSHFSHLEPYKGMPVFFDTNDCENNWYSFDQKVAILEELLPNEPMLYFPHPSQRLNLCQRIPRLVDMSGRTHGWNEMACYYLRPGRFISVFSSAAFTLRRIYGLDFENILLFNKFYERTAHPAFNIGQQARSYLSCAS